MKIIKSILIIFSCIYICGCAVKTSTAELSSSAKEQYRYCAYEVEMQDSKYSCGAAVLSGLMTYWGKPLSEEQVLQSHPPSSEFGYSVKEVRDILKQNGFASFVKIGTLGSIKTELDKGRPVVLPLSIPRSTLTSSFYSNDFTIGRILSRRLMETFSSYNHYVAIIGYSEGTFLVGDPAYGIKSVDAERLERAWNKLGNVMILAASHNQPKQL